MKIINEDAHNTVLKGAETLYNAVSSTLGPKGRNVLIKGPDGLTVTHDGVTVANAISPEGDDYYGVELIKRSSNKMNDTTGDGTTTVAVLTYHLLLGLIDRINEGENSMMLKRELEQVSQEVLNKIDERTIKVNKGRLRQVASISAGNEEIGKMVADTVWSIGANGKIVTEMTSSPKTTVQKVKGAKVNYGFSSHLFTTDSKSGEARLNNPAVLVYDGKISSIHDILPLMEEMAQHQASTLAIFCEEASEDVLINLIHNKQKGVFNSVVVEVPKHATIRLEDIAGRTGATYLSGSKGDSIKGGGVKALGTAEVIVSNASETSIIGGGGDLELYKDTLDSSDPKTKDRIAALDGKMAVIKIGGINEDEVVERSHRIEDAICSAQAALRGGIVAGGGSTLLEIAEAVDNDTVARSLRAPHLKLLANAGIYEDIELEAGHCFDVLTGKVVEAVVSGIVDPAEVTRNAVETAIATAAISITTATIVDTERKDD